MAVVALSGYVLQLMFFVIKVLQQATSRCVLYGVEDCEEAIVTLVSGGEWDEALRLVNYSVSL